MPNPAQQPTWQGAAKKLFKCLSLIGVKCLLEEAGPRG
jgi:hypothetical protein